MVHLKRMPGLAEQTEGEDDVHVASGGGHGWQAGLIGQSAEDLYLGPVAQAGDVARSRSDQVGGVAVQNRYNKTISCRKPINKMKKKTIN